MIPKNVRSWCSGRPPTCLHFTYGSLSSMRRRRPLQARPARRRRQSCRRRPVGGALQGLPSRPPFQPAGRPQPCCRPPQAAGVRRDPRARRHPRSVHPRHRNHRWLPAAAGPQVQDLVSARSHYVLRPPARPEPRTPIQEVGSVEEDVYPFAVVGVDEDQEQHEVEQQVDADNVGQRLGNREEPGLEQGKREDEKRCPGVESQLPQE